MGKVPTYSICSAETGKLLYGVPWKTEDDVEKEVEEEVEEEENEGEDEGEDEGERTVCQLAWSRIFK